MFNISSIQKVTVQFNCKKQLNYGEALYVVGDFVELGRWEPKFGVKMMCKNESEWTVDVELNTNFFKCTNEKEFHYKYFISGYECFDGVHEWEAHNDHTIDISFFSSYHKTVCLDHWETPDKTVVKFHAPKKIFAKRTCRAFASPSGSLVKPHI